MSCTSGGLGSRVAKRYRLWPLKYFSAGSGFSGGSARMPRRPPGVRPKLFARPRSCASLAAPNPPGSSHFSNFIVALPAQKPPSCLVPRTPKLFGPCKQPALAGDHRTTCPLGRGGRTSRMGTQKGRGSQGESDSLGHRCHRADETGVRIKKRGDPDLTNLIPREAVLTEHDDLIQKLFSEKFSTRVLRHCCDFCSNFRIAFHWFFPFKAVSSPLNS